MEKSDLIIVKAHFKLYPTEEGGRKTAIISGYRPNHVFEYKDNSNDLVATYIGDINFEGQEFGFIGFRAYSLALIYGGKLTGTEKVVRHTEKESPHTNSTFGSCRHESQTLKNQKSYFLANARKETTE
jgi:hypothetical protein